MYACISNLSLSFVTPVGIEVFGCFIFQPFVLFKRLFEGVSVVGVAKGQCPHYDACGLGVKNGYFVAVFILFVLFAFGDAMYPGFVQGVDLVFAVPLLLQDPVKEGQ